MAPMRALMHRIGRRSRMSAATGMALVALVASATPVSPHPAAPDVDRGVWRTAAPAPVKRTEVAAAALLDRIYVVGGFEKPSLSNALRFAITPAVEAYDPATDRWTTKTSMPEELHHVGIGVLDGRLYVVGGYKQSGFSVWQPVPTLYVYDPVADTWSEGPPMPTARGALSVAVLDGKLYAIGGYDGKANSAAVEVYDPGHGTWTSRAPLPTPRDHLACAAAAGKIYVIGGRLNGDYRRNLAVTEVYDPAADRWSRGADLPTARSGMAAVEVEGKVYVFGGESGEGTFRENERYDPARDAWDTMAPLPTARHGLGSAVVRGRIYAISGGPTPGGSFSDLNDVFTPPVGP